MFERNSIDPASQMRGDAAAVEITFQDGQTAAGRLMLPQGRRLYDLLNGQTMFLTFEPFDGETAFISRDTIAAVKTIGETAKALPQERNVDGAFDPRKTLGVAADADWETVHKAYRALSFRYHPDRYATAQLPEEVHAYLESRSRAINTAYRVLQEGADARKASKAATAAPVYQRAGSAFSAPARASRMAAGPVR